VGIACYLGYAHSVLVALLHLHLVDRDLVQGRTHEGLRLKRLHNLTLTLPPSERVGVDVARLELRVLKLGAVTLHVFVKLLQGNGLIAPGFPGGHWVPVLLHLRKARLLPSPSAATPTITLPAEMTYIHCR